MEVRKYLFGINGLIVVDKNIHCVVGDITSQPWHFKSLKDNLHCVQAVQYNALNYP